MKALVKQAGLTVLNTGPVYSLLQRRALRDTPVTVLCYHTLRADDDPIDAWIALSVSDFRAQIAMLHKYYDIVSLDAALDPAPKGSPPRVVLTFDDGEWGLHEHLLPLIGELDIPVTIYVATAHIKTGTPYWFDRVMNALQGPDAQTITLQGKSFAIGPERGTARWMQIRAVLEHLKGTDPGARDALADEVVAQGRAPDGFTPLTPMTLAQLQTVAADPRVTIGAHTHGHELLDQLPLDQALGSIARSRDLLADWTWRDIRHFAYPNGNYTSDLMSGIAGLGLRTAVILEDRLAGKDDDPFALPRIGVGRYDALNRLKLRLVGV